MQLAEAEHSEAPDRSHDGVAQLRQKTATQTGKKVGVEIAAMQGILCINIKTYFYRHVKERGELVGRRLRRSGVLTRLKNRKILQ